MRKVDENERIRKKRQIDHVTRCHGNQKVQWLTERGTLFKCNHDVTVLVPPWCYVTMVLRHHGDCGEVVVHDLQNVF